MTRGSRVPYSLALHSQALQSCSPKTSRAFSSSRSIETRVRGRRDAGCSTRQPLHRTTSINGSVELALAAHPHHAAIHYPDATELRPIWVTSRFVPVTFAAVEIVAHPAELAGCA